MADGAPSPGPTGSQPMQERSQTPPAATASQGTHEASEAPPAASDPAGRIERASGGLSEVAAGGDPSRSAHSNSLAAQGMDGRQTEVQDSAMRGVQSADGEPPAVAPSAYVPQAFADAPAAAPQPAPATPLAEDTQALSRQLERAQQAQPSPAAAAAVASTAGGPSAVAASLLSEAQRLTAQQVAASRSPAASQPGAAKRPRHSAPSPRAPTLPPLGDANAADMHAGAAHVGGAPPAPPLLPAAVLVPGYLAPGPCPPESIAGLPGISPHHVPVMPYMEGVEVALSKGSEQPLTFHRRVMRPLSMFLPAVFQHLSIQDTSVCGLATYAMRAMLEDHACGRLAFYDRLTQHAHRQDWPGYALMVLEYISMAGYDASALFKIPNGQPPQ